MATARILTSPNIFIKQHQAVIVMPTSKDKQPADIDVLRANINNETSQIQWQELQRFFAGGWLIYVSANSNLLDVAVAFTQDDKEAVSKWLTSGEVAKVSDQQAKQWHENNTTFWANVVKPWVLIQPLDTAEDNTEEPNQIH